MSVKFYTTTTVIVMATKYTRTYKTKIDYTADLLLLG